jgi:hypothetical protein
MTLSLAGGQFVWYLNLRNRNVQIKFVLYIYKMVTCVFYNYILPKKKYSRDTPQNMSEISSLIGGPRQSALSAPPPLGCPCLPVKCGLLIDGVHLIN